MRSSPDAKDKATAAFLTMLASEMTELPQATAAGAQAVMREHILMPEDASDGAIA